MRQKDAIPDLSFALLLSLLLLLGAWGIYFYYTQRITEPPDSLLESFPMELGSWIAQDIPASDYLLEVPASDNFILREYASLQGKKILLFVLYSSDNRHIGHPPELRYLGEGATITGRSFVYVTERIKATRLIVDHAQSREMEIFWYKVGKRNTNSYLRQQITMIAHRMRNQPERGIALIRMKTSVDTSEEAAFDLLKDFCTGIEQSLNKHLP